VPQLQRICLTSHPPKSKPHYVQLRRFTGGRPALRFYNRAVASSVKIEFPPRLIQLLFDYVYLSRKFRCLAWRALALLEESTILLDPIVADCFKKFTLTAIHKFL
jgi:hypothetical protein